VSVIYAAVSAAGFGAAIALAGTAPLMPFVILSPFALVYVVYDTQRRSRGLLPELAGPIALAGVAIGIALAGGWGWVESWALWLILISRTLPSIFYVRARLRLERGQPIDRSRLFAIHLVFALVLLVLFVRGYAPFVALAAFVLLWVRATRGLSRFRRPSKAIRIGVLEIAYGLVYVTITVVGYRLGL
jgi:hypothetical protein